MTHPHVLLARGDLFRRLDELRDDPRFLALRIHTFLRRIHVFIALLVGQDIFEFVEGYLLGVLLLLLLLFLGELLEHGLVQDVVDLELLLALLLGLFLASLSLLIDQLQLSLDLLFVKYFVLIAVHHLLDFIFEAFDDLVFFRKPRRLNLILGYQLD